jgi:hypothetical protein
MRVSYKLSVAIVMMWAASGFQSTVQAQNEQQNPKPKCPLQLLKCVAGAFINDQLYTNQL